MLHARLVGARELPADVALYKIDSFFPVICLDHSGEHYEVGFNDLVCNGVIWINNSEADIPMVSPRPAALVVQ